MINKIKQGFITNTLTELNAIEIHLDTNNDTLGTSSDCFIETVFKAVHNIKGTAPMVGIFGLEDITHSVERVYVALRDGNLSLSDEIISNTIKLIPAIKAELGIKPQVNVNSEDVSNTLRFFDSLIS